MCPFEDAISSLFLNRRLTALPLSRCCVVFFFADLFFLDGMMGVLPNVALCINV